MNIKDELSHFIKQYGGELLGYGSHGCVFGPNYKCNIDDIRDENLISKIIPKSHSYEEYYNIIKLNINLIDSYDKFFVIPINICELKEEFLNEEFKTCPIILKKKFETDDLFNIIQPYAGVDLSKIIRSSNMLAKYIPDPNKVLLHFLNLLIGLGLLNKYDCIHRDIKPGNITLLKGGLARFIDYGLSAKYKKSILEDSGKIDYDWDWAKTDYIYWPKDLQILSSSKNKGLHTKIKQLLAGKSQNESVSILIEESAKLFTLYTGYSLHFYPEDKQSQFQSLVEFMIDVFIKKIFESNTFDVSGHLIQSKWDVFSLGQTFSEILKRSKIELSDESVKIPLHKLITDMVSLHPIKRPSIKECIERFTILIPDTLVDKYEAEFNELFKIAREQLEIEIEIHTPQSESDYSSESDIEFDLSDED